MLRHYFLFALRQFRRNSAYGSLTVAGLAIGIASCLLIFLYVQEERSYDRFHEHADRLFRLDKVVTPRTGGRERHVITSGPMGPALATDYPEVEAAVRVLPWFDEVLVRHDQEAVQVSDFVFVDSTFFEVFSFDLHRGDPGSVLAVPMSAVITESMAGRLFGSSDPVGRQLIGLNDLAYTVTGIAADPPRQSHLTFDVAVSFSSLEPGRGGLEFNWIDNWYPQALCTYLLLETRSSRETLATKLADFMDRRFPDRADQYELYLQPLTDIYLGSSHLLFTGRTRTGNRTYVRVLGLVAILILVIAAINFVNMGTARATRRAHEIGVRKAVGAGRQELVAQFLGENMFVAGAGLVFAVVVLQALLPVYQGATGNTLPFGVWSNPALVVMLLAVWLTVGVAAGAYPAIYLSRLQSAYVLRGGTERTPFGGRSRRVLVAVQFAVSIALIACTALVYRQTLFMQSRDPGFDRQRIVVLDIGNTAISEHAEAFRDALAAIPGVEQTAGTNSVPGRSMMSFGINPEGKAQDETWTSAAIRLDDFNLLDTYRMEMAAGRWFSDDRPTDRTHAIVINEALARSLGWTNEEAIGRRLDARGEVDEGTVIGVVRDFHFESLRRPIQPLFMYYASRHGMLSVRLTGEDVAETIDRIGAAWKEFDPVYPFDYAFLDNELAALYQSERSLSRSLGGFSVLGVLVACFGLMGLAAFAAEQRTKEIGIRKVFGATRLGVVRLLTGEVLRLVLLASVVAVPLSWLAGHRWLSGFAFRASGTIWIIVAAAVVTMLMAVVTVSWQTWRAASVNPVESLRYE